MAFTARDDDFLALTRFCEKLAAKVESCEQEVAQLKTRLSKIERGDPYGLEDDEEPESPPTKIGRPTLKDRGQMELDRDHILSFLQTDWLAIEQIIADSESTEDLQAALSARFLPAKRGNPGFERLLNYSKQLRKFLTESRRYQGDPLEIACAMAGVPEMKPRSSFDSFFAKKNLGKFNAQHVGVMEERRKRIAVGKKRKPTSRSEVESGAT
jgi:hypothetical protein